VAAEAPRFAAAREGVAAKREVPPAGAGSVARMLWLAKSDHIPAAAGERAGTERLMSAL
jgi:hypothetical protein